MADQYISHSCIYLFSLQQTFYRLMIGTKCSVSLRSHYIFHHRRTHKRKQIKIHIPPFITHGHLLDMFLWLLRRHTCHIQILFLQNASVEIYSRCTVMVHTDHHHNRIRHFLFQIQYKPVKYTDCFCRRYSFIVNITGNHNGVRLFLLCLFHHLLQDKLLILQQISVV